MPQRQDEKDSKKGLTFICDEPANEDKFGTHTAIVDAIASAIADQRNIRLVGLLGRWGTGKSTIIGHLSKSLESRHKDKFAVFTYDVWAHQGDPARRSILEELIAKLGLTETKEWVQVVAEISGSTESSSTTTTTRLSGWGKVFFILLILLPLFLAFIDGDTLRLIFTDNPNGVSRAIVIALMIYAVVLSITLFGAYASSMNRRLLQDRNVPIPKRFRAFLRSGEDLLSIALTRTFPASASTTLRKSQPTAIEFRRYLRRVIDSQRPRRLVFVIDNLDRISPSEALDLWSIMVGMVADESHRMDSTIEPIVILPFDPVALEQIIPGGGLQGHTASDLIEKSFDVTFEVPPPVLSNWRSYFRDQYQKCGFLNFTDNSTFEQYWTIRNFEKSIGQSRVTPRKIIRFLNKMVSLSQQQIESFRPAILSYFIVNEIAIQTHCLSFLKNSQPSFDDSNAWQLKIGAIAFGTTEAEAAQILLGDELATSLSTRHFDKFQSAATIAGFDDVVRNFVEDPPRDDAGVLDGGLLTALAAFCGEAQQIKDPVLWPLLWKAWKATPASADPLSATAIATFLDALPDLATTDANLLLDRIVEQARITTESDTLVELLKVGERITTIADDDLKVSVRKDADLLLRLLRVAPAESKLAERLRCDCSFADLAKVVVDRVTGRLAVLAPPAFDLVASRVREGQATGTKSDFFEGVGTGLKEIVLDVESPDESIAAAARILASRDNQALRYAQIVTELENEGRLGELVDAAIENNADAIASDVTGLRLTAGKMPTGEQVQGLSRWLSKPENAALLLASIRQMNQGSFLPCLRSREVAGNNIDPILRPLLIEAVRKRNIGRAANSAWFAKSFAKVVSWMGPAEAEFYAKEIFTWQGFAGHLQMLSEADFLLYISKLETPLAKTALEDKLKGFDAAQFANLLVSGDTLWQAYNRYKPNIGERQSAKSELAKGLVTVFDGSKGEIGKRIGDRALKLHGLLSAAAQKDVIRVSVTNAMENRRVGQFLFLTTVEKFKEYTSKPVVAAAAIGGLFNQFVRTRDGLTYVERNATSMSHISAEALLPIRKVLRRKLRSTNARAVDWATYVMDKAGLRE